MTASIGHTRIYLAGFMGTGKSTLGPVVARTLGWTFVDLDDEIERDAGQSVQELFAIGGEAGFRDRERAALARIASDRHVVVALGGGAILDPESRSLVVGSGVLVGLAARLSTLVNRLVSDAAARPLLQDDLGRPLTGTDLTDRIRSLLEARRATYEVAHVTVDTDAGSIRETAERVIAAVRSVPVAPSGTP